MAVQSSPSDDSSSFVPSFSRERIRDSLHAGKFVANFVNRRIFDRGGRRGGREITDRKNGFTIEASNAACVYENYGQSSDSSSSTRASTRKLPTVFRSNIFTLCCGSRARPFSCKPPRISKKRDSETIGERNILKEKERKKPIDLANLRILDLSRSFESREQIHSNDMNAVEIAWL